VELVLVASLHLAICARLRWSLGASAPPFETCNPRLGWLKGAVRGGSSLPSGVADEVIPEASLQKKRASPQHWEAGLAPVIAGPIPAGPGPAAISIEGGEAARAFAWPLHIRPGAVADRRALRAGRGPGPWGCQLQVTAAEVIGMPERPNLIPQFGAVLSQTVHDSDFRNRLRQ